MNDSQKFTNVKESVSSAEWQLRCDLAACYRYAADQKWDDLIFTHFSVRLPGKDKQFLINPFGVLFEEITASNLVKIDIKGKPLRPTPYIVNPAGFVLHSAIHSAREDAHCIIHLHTPEGIAVAAQKEGLLPISQTALSVFSDLAYHDYEGIVFDAEEKERLIPNIGEKNCILLRNHGLLATGKTIAEAFLRIYFLQRACEAQIMAQSGGAELIHLSDKVIERVYSQTVEVGDLIANLSWGAVISRIERIGPDYKT
ncbi:MAG: class II aldolase/adducin family protein [Proteobacteria bacterium]|nr:class II aldolase/adducin family protein [Pseudomonadota bacterium]